LISRDKKKETGRAFEIRDQEGAGSTPVSPTSSLFAYFLEQSSGHRVGGEKLPFIIFNRVKDFLILRIKKNTQMAD